MSKTKKLGRRRGAAKNLGDVTINDFANAPVGNFRIKKSDNNVVLAVKKEIVSDDVKDNWDDDSEDENLNIKEGRGKKRALSENSNNNNNPEGFDYPLDIWFLISEYIRPEDVGTFASLCKSSLKVVLSARFWIFMYKKYYKNIPNLPVQFKPECLIRKYGIRTSVIRALHFMYTPFIEKSKQIDMNKKHPNILQNKQCLSHWYIKKNKKWIFYFKFKLNNPLSFHRNKNKTNDLIEILNDIFVNPEEDCCILEVSSTEFTLIQPVIGHTLTSVSLSLAQGLCSYRLQLQFGNHLDKFYSPRGGVTGINVVIDPVKEIRVLNWWHPLYPNFQN